MGWGCWEETEPLVLSGQGREAAGFERAMPEHIAADAFGEKEAVRPLLSLVSILQQVFSV